MKDDVNVAAVVGLYKRLSPFEQERVRELIRGRNA